MRQTVTNGRRDLGLFLLLALLVLTLGATLSLSYSIGPNYRNISVDTRVNITDAKPEVLKVSIDNGADNVTLTAGATHRVICNASVQDWNGASTIANVTAVFFDGDSIAHSGADDNNNHYTNLTCEEVEVSGFYANYTCTFDVWYYANATNNWVCNVTATDTYDFVGIDYGWNFNTTEILPLLAINVTPLIDYGDMAVEDTTAVGIEANVTNFGNQMINISVYGYGNSSGDGYAMVCQIGTIAISNERVGLNPLTAWGAYTPLASSPTIIPGLTMDRESVDGTQIVNSTYWKLYVPPNPFGECNGTVVFQAEAAD